MSEYLFEDMFPEPEPETPPPGLGKDAQRTWRRKRMLERGVHPATEVPLKGNGETCGSCRFLWRKSMGNFRGWKCELASLNADNDGPDMVKSWPACNWWEAPRNA